MIKQGELAATQKQQLQFMEQNQNLMCVIRQLQERLHWYTAQGKFRNEKPSDELQRFQDLEKEVL